MFYYKNKVKPIVILCAIILVLAVAVSFCLWDDTSIKSLTANAGTADFTGKLPHTSNLALGDRSMSISGVTYTVVNHYDTGGVKFITLLSDTISGLSCTWSHAAHDRTSSAYDNSGANGIKARITNYYNSSVNNAGINVGSGTIGNINDEKHKIVNHLGGGWALWAPSEHEMYGSKSYGNIALDGNQPQMKWIIEKKNDGQTSAPGSRNTGAYYWLRSPCSDYADRACLVSDGGSLNYGVVYYSNVVRVALNLAI